MKTRRIEVYPLYGKETEVRKAQVFLVETDSSLDSPKVKKIFADSLCEKTLFNAVEAETYLEGANAVEVFSKPGVTETRGPVTKKLLGLQGIKARVAVGDIYFCRGMDTVALKKKVENRWANTLVHHVRPLDPERFSSPRLPSIALSRNDRVEHIALETIGPWTEARSLGFSDGEIEAIVSFALAQGRETLSDVELEVLAQTWSEHCKHKIFSASIDYSERGDHPYKKIGPKRIPGLFKTYIEGVTREVGREEMLLSVFVDNAGIVSFDDVLNLCFKVETHNSPSALDPYGGALTGILGVNRDILGAGLGAKPVANTDIFCFPPLELEDTHPEDLPKTVMPPRRILEGVHKGVEDGGNKSGIPTVNGSILYHPSYAGKPLVFVGTLGVMPREIGGRPTAVKGAQEGDHIYMVGGAVGADGIHGAVFSSMELKDDASTGAVQIGDAFEQKRVTDFLLEARDQSLFNSVTDNGAGGLSSSIGEMARDTNGALLKLERVPLKYPGLSPWEIVVSESQERMSFAVPPSKVQAFEALANKHAVGAYALGFFERTGYFHIKNGSETVGHLPMDFLHGGLPSMTLTAHWEGTKAHPCPYGSEKNPPPPVNPLDALLALLSSPNIASKESLVRQYDHEVQGQTIQRPFCEGSYTGPSDGAILSLEVPGGGAHTGVALAHGINPFLSEEDPYRMATACVDECVRNLLCSSGILHHMALLDNFCWPDPLSSPHNPEGGHHLGQLVRTCEGLRDACRVFRLPLISGKDSMKNNYRGPSRSGKPLAFGVLPTLLVSGLAKVDTRRPVGNCARKPGEVVAELGPGTMSLRASAFSRLYRVSGETLLPPVNLEKSLDIFQRVEKARDMGLFSALHDISDGGFLTALAEMLFPCNLGAKIAGDGTNGSLFGEGPSSFVALVPKERLGEVTKIMGDCLNIWGTVDNSSHLSLETPGKTFRISTLDCYRAWDGGVLKEP